MLYYRIMTVSWQTFRTASSADDDDDRVRGGPEPSPEDAGIWPPLPRAFSEGDARRALLRDLVLRALI